MCDPPRAVRVDHIADEKQRKAIQGGLRQAVARTGEAGAAGHHGHTRSARDLAVRRGHDAGCGFTVGKHEIQAQIVGSGDQVQVGTTARHAEQLADPGRLKSSCERAGAVLLCGHGVGPAARLHSARTASVCSPSIGAASPDPRRRTAELDRATCDADASTGGMVELDHHVTHCDV